MKHNNRLLLGDCFELLKTVPDKSVDLIITDPPYEFDSGGVGGAFGSKKRDYHKEYLALYKDTENEKLANTEGSRLISNGFDISLLDEFERVMKKTNIYIWCSKAQLGKLINYYESKGRAIDLLTWHKTNPTPTCNNTYLSDTEYLVFARMRGVKVYGSYHTKKKFYVSPVNTADKKKWQHPTIKPQEIIENLIINSSVEGDTVLDPFMGSGTTGAACAKLGGRNFIGIEIDERYYEIAKKRIEEVGKT